MGSICEGTRLGRYIVGARLGAGGAGEVYRAEHSLLGTTHALKVLHDDSPDCAERLLHEGRVQAALEHANLVPVRDVLLEEQRPVLVMDLVEGPALSQLMDAMTLELPDAQRLFLGVVEAVAVAHRQGVVHRDLKPSNVLIDQAVCPPEPRVVDFGISRSAEAEQHTPTDQRLGTLGYAAPECLRGQPADVRSDVFSLGVMAYEMVCGIRPYAHSDIYRRMQAMVEGDFVPPQSRQPELDPLWATAIQACLSPDPEARPADAGTLLAILSGEERLEGEHLAPARAAVGHRRPPGWRWLPGLALGGGSTVVVLGVAGALVSDLRADLHAERTHRHALGAEEPTEQLALLRAAASLSGVEDVDADRFGNLLAVGAATRIIPGEAPVVTSAVTSDGRTLAVLDDAGQGRLLTLETGELLHAWQTGLQHPRNLQISRDGAVAAAQPHPTIGRSADGARVWTVADNRPRIFAEAARKVRLNAPGTVAFLLVGSVPGDLFVEAWDVRSGERRWQTPVPAATQGLQLSPDGDQIAVWTASETWNLDTSSGARGPEVRALPGRRSTLLWWPLADVQTWTDSGGFGVFVNGVERLSSEAHAGTFAQVSKDGTRLLVGGGSSRTVQLWDLAARQQVASWTHVGWVAPRFIDDDRLVVSTGPDRSVFVHEARHGQHMMTLTGNADSVTTMEAIEGGWITGSRSGEVRVWSLPSETVGLLTRTTLGFSPATTSYAKTGTVFGVKGGAVLSWSAEAGLVREVDVADALLVAPSPDGEWLVVAHENDVVSVTKRGAETAHISLSMPWSPTCAAVAPGHDRLLVGSTLGWQLVRMSTAEVIATGRMPAPDDGVNPRSVPTQCALTADGRIALLGGTTATLVLEGPSGFDLLPIDTDGSGVAELRLHATGALVAMGQYSGAVTTWTPEGGMQRLTGHDEAVVAIALSEAADRFATVSRDGVVQLWTEAGARLSRALSPRPLSSVGFHAGEEVLLTGSRDGHLQWWSVESGALLGTLDGDNTAIFQIVIDPVRGRVTTVDATHQITEWDSSRFQRAETSLASSGRWTNQRVCEGTQRVVPVVPFPDPETLWAPADLCGGRP